MPEVVFSGTIRISGMLSSTVLRGLSATVPLTGFYTEQFVLADGATRQINPQAQPNPDFAFCTATQVCRVNLGGHPTFDSAASLGWEFKDFFGLAGSGIVSGPTLFNFANSSGNSAVITVYVTQ